MTRTIRVRRKDDSATGKNNKQRTTNKEQQTKNNEQRKTNKEQRTKSNEQGTTNEEQRKRTVNKEQRTKNNEQRTTNKEQQTKNNKQRTTNEEQATVHSGSIFTCNKCRLPSGTVIIFFLLLKESIQPTGVYWVGWAELTCPPAAAAACYLSYRDGEGKEGGGGRVWLRPPRTQAVS